MSEELKKKGSLIFTRESRQGKSFADRRLSGPVGPIEGADEPRARGYNWTL
jgi:hypothetical protein